MGVCARGCVCTWVGVCTWACVCMGVCARGCMCTWVQVGVGVHVLVLAQHVGLTLR